MIHNPAIGMRVRFYREGGLGTLLNNNLGTISNLCPWGEPNNYSVVSVRFDNPVRAANASNEVVCSSCYLFFTSTEEEKDWQSREKNNRERENHAMKFL